MAEPSLEQNRVETDLITPKTSGGSVQIDNIYGSDGLWHNYDGDGIKVSGADEDNHVLITRTKVEISSAGATNSLVLRNNDEATWTINSDGSGGLTFTCAGS